MLRFWSRVSEMNSRNKDSNAFEPNLESWEICTRRKDMLRRHQARSRLSVIAAGTQTS